MARSSRCWILALIASAFVPASADAATTIGKLNSPVYCTALPGGSAAVQTAGAQYAIPERGVLTSVQSGPFPSTASSTVFVFRRGTIASSLMQVGSVPMTGSGVLDAPARIAVLPGDLLAVGGSACVSPPGTAPVPGETFALASLPTYPPIGFPTDLFLLQSNNPGGFNVRAVHERDVDRDGFGDDTQDQCTDDAELQRPCPKDIALTASTADARVPVGGLQVVTLRMRASSESKVGDARIAATLPEGLELVGATPSQGSCTGLDCTLGDLSAGGSALVVAAVRPTSAGAKSFAATGSVTDDVNSANNAAAAQFDAIGPAVAPLAATPGAGAEGSAGAAGVAVASTAVGTAARTCRVPKLTGFSRSTARIVLQAATCRLGTVKTRRVPRGRRAVGATRVVGQSVRAGQERPGATRVDVTLGRKTVARRRR